MSDWLKWLAKWIFYAVMAVIGWMGLAHFDIPEKVLTSIMGTRS